MDTTPNELLLSALSVLEQWRDRFGDDMPDQTAMDFAASLRMDAELFATNVLLENAKQLGFASDGGEWSKQPKKPSDTCCG